MAVDKNTSTYLLHVLGLFLSLSLNNSDIFAPLKLPRSILESHCQSIIHTHTQCNQCLSLASRSEPKTECENENVNGLIVYGQYV